MKAGAAPFLTPGFLHSFEGRDALGLALALLFSTGWGFCRQRQSALELTPSAWHVWLSPCCR